jgi:RNA polymerase sigma-70 factor, ECF subfamily
VSRLEEASDDELVEQARARGRADARPFEMLMRRHQGFVAANCRAITRSPSDADDLAQEVFVKAYFGLARFEDRAQFRTWIQRIKVNHCLNFLRKRRGVVMVDTDEDAPDRHPELRVAPAAVAVLEAAGDRQRIVDVLDTMPDTLRIPLMLRDGDGLSYDEIAAQLGISLSAVKMRIKRGRELFRARFDLTPAGPGQQVPA